MIHRTSSSTPTGSLMTKLDEFHDLFYNEVLKPHQRVWLDLILGEDDIFILGSRRIGKSFVSSYAAVVLALGHDSRPAADVVCISKDLRTAQELIREVTKHADAMNQLEHVTHGTRGSQTSVWLRNGKKIMAMPGMPESARGLSGHVIVDEFAGNPADHDELFAMATTIPSSHKHLKTIILTNADHQESWTDGFCNNPSDMWDDRRFGFRVVRTNIDDVYPDGYPEHIETQRRRLPARIWSREYLCEFSTGQDVLFPLDVLSELVADPTEDPSAVSVLAWDPGFTGDPAGFVVCDVSPGRVCVRESGLLWNQSEQEQRAHIERLVNTWDVTKILVDPGTAGFTLAANLKQRWGGMCDKMSVNSKRYAIWTNELERLIDENSLTISGEGWDSLVKQINRLGKDKSGKLVVPRTRHGEKRCHQDAAVALLMVMEVLPSSRPRHAMQPMPHLGRRSDFRGF